MIAMSVANGVSWVTSVISYHVTSAIPSTNDTENTATDSILIQLVFKAVKLGSCVFIIV